MKKSDPDWKSQIWVTVALVYPTEQYMSGHWQEEERVRIRDTRYVKHQLFQQIVMRVWRISVRKLTERPSIAMYQCGCFMSG